MKFLIRTVTLSLCLLLYTASITNADDDPRGKRGEGSLGTRDTTYAHTVAIPYNVNAYGFMTGLHIVSDYSGTKEYKIWFYHGDTAYASPVKNIPAAGWTGLVQNLLPNPSSFQNESLIYIDSTHEFYVVQFIFNAYGFAHQTFYSYPIEQL